MHTERRDTIVIIMTEQNFCHYYNITGVPIHCPNEPKVASRHIHFFKLMVSKSGITKKTVHDCMVKSYSLQACVWLLAQDFTCVKLA